jgi:hypothetical protein
MIDNISEIHHIEFLLVNIKPNLKIGFFFGLEKLGGEL